jgi:predicted lipoprotein with Yx(FWY)xxD motif
MAVVARGCSASPFAVGGGAETTRHTPRRRPGAAAYCDGRRRKIRPGADDGGPAAADDPPMTRKKQAWEHFTATTAALPVVALVVAGCGGGGSATASATPATAPSGKAATVGAAANGTLGQILVDSRGRTLYLFEADSGTKSACTGVCAETWPPLRAGGKPLAGNGITASKLGTSARTDGKPQVTYNGHPLYLYTNDQHPGDVNGEGVNAFGAPWYALSPTGTRVLSASATSNPGEGGNGY